MTTIYWLLPIFVVAVAVAVLPVLFGTIKHKEWEEREAALKDRQQLQIAGRDSAWEPDEPQVHVALQDVHAEAVALLQRIEHLSQRVDGAAERPERSSTMIMAGRQS
jgi:hypothetical protein